MSFWTDVAETTNNSFAEDDFEAVASRLITEQILYASDRGSRVPYELVRDFERDFKRALEPLGYIIRVNSQLRYACAIPKHAKMSSVTVEQTLLALVLLKIFDEETRAGHLDENGEVTCDLVTLEVKYRQETGGRELATGGKLATLMQWMKRWGLARVAEEDRNQFGHGETSQPYVVIIRPGIAEVLGEAAVARIAHFTRIDAEAESSELTDEEGSAA